MKRILIGAGGWAYFKVLGYDSLDAYSRAFNFVEVNSTFYEYPEINLVKSWRRRVPSNFKFSVRCHQDLTHKYKLEPCEEAFETLKRMLQICKILKADILHLQTTPTLKLNQSKITSIQNFLESSSLEGVRLSWEIRSTKSNFFNDDVKRLMKKFNIIPCVDLSKEEPAVESDILYSRLFGKGIHNIYQFTDEELMDIDEKASGANYRSVALSFHGAKMYKDAARYKIYKQTGRFSAVTKSRGLNSLREVLMEDAKFPYKKREIIQHQGWKVIDLTRDKRVHASQILQKLPNKSFNDVEEVIRALKSVE